MLSTHDQRRGREVNCLPLFVFQEPMCSIET